jgi:hypothetical protein
MRWRGVHRGFLLTSSIREFLMTENQTDRVWLMPQKFWSATKEMSVDETERLVEHLMLLSAAQDFESLRKFDFIFVGQPDFRRPAA